MLSRQGTDLESEEVRKVAAALSAAQECRRKGSPQQEPLQVPDGLIVKVQERQSMPHSMAPLHIGRLVCAQQRALSENFDQEKYSKVYYRPSIEYICPKLIQCMWWSYACLGGLMGALVERARTSR